MSERVGPIDGREAGGWSAWKRFSSFAVRPAFKLLHQARQDQCRPNFAHVRLGAAADSLVAGDHPQGSVLTTERADFLVESDRPLRAMDRSYALLDRAEAIAPELFR